MPILLALIANILSRKGSLPLPRTCELASVKVMPKLCKLGLRRPGSTVELLDESNAGVGGDSDENACVLVRD